VEYSGYVYVFLGARLKNVYTAPMMSTTFTAKSALVLLTPHLSGSFKQNFLAIANVLLSNVLLIVGVVAVFALILAGMRFIIASGNPEKAKAARDSVIQVIIGVIVVVSVFSIIRFAGSLANTIANSLNQ